MFGKLNVMNNVLRQQNPFTRVTPVSGSGLVNIFRSTVAFRQFSAEAEYEKEISDIEKDHAERKKRIMSKVGEIVSVKCDKTVNVMIYNQKLVKKYNKHIQTRRKIMAHDENCVGKLGDFVRIATHRPISKMKRHYLIDVIRRAPVVTESGEVEISSRKVEMNVNEAKPVKVKAKKLGYVRPETADSPPGQKK